MSKPKKVYGNKEDRRLIVCHKGNHYISPLETRVGKGQRVPVLVGEEPDTVVVLGETWTLKGSYTKGGKTFPKSGSSRPTRALRKRFQPKKVVSTSRPILKPLESALSSIKETAPNSGAECLMRVAYQNWCNGLSRLKLFQGFNYPDADDTARVHELGRQIMREHGVNC